MSQTPTEIKDTAIAYQDLFLKWWKPATTAENYWQGIKKTQKGDAQGWL